MRIVEANPGWLARVLLGLLVAAMLFNAADTLHPTPARRVAADHLFSIMNWEATNFLQKWTHLLLKTLSRSNPNPEERMALVDEYLTLARFAEKEEDRIEGVHLRRTGASASGAATKEKSAPARDYLDELLESKEKLRLWAEEAVESELSAVLIDEGLGGRWDILFPPVDLRFGQPPTLLVTSPRDRIQRWEVVLLDPDLPLFERGLLEDELLERHNFSALVGNLAGLSTYPTMVSDLAPLREVLRTAAHEWLHAYLYFRPLGRGFWTSEQMSTLNESAVELAGREIGDAAFARMGGDLNDSARRYLSPEQRNPRFTAELRETRAGVEELLDEGQVEEAEQYMKERWWLLALGGYRLRKLNQAYFALHGIYAYSPGSVSPIGDQIKELRALLPDAGSFVRTISRVSSHAEFLRVLDSLKAQAGGQASDDETSRTAAPVGESEASLTMDGGPLSTGVPLSFYNGNVSAG